METNNLLTCARKAYADGVSERLRQAEQERYGYIKKFCEIIGRDFEKDILEAAASGWLSVYYYVDDNASYEPEDMLAAVQKLAPGFTVTVSPNNDLGAGCVCISFDP